jgi:PhzF family phenazine biosynthesis protein
MLLSLYHVDAFAEKVFKGNPAAVVPLHEWLEDDVMQKIAMENNLSETAFFVKTDDGYHLRWFTPANEIDLCGHATLGAAYIIKNFVEPPVQEISFSTEKAGLLKVTIHEGMYTLDFPARMPQACEPPKELLESLGNPTAIEVLRSRDYFVVLPDEQAVLNIEPDFNLLSTIETVGVIVTAKGHEADAVSRCFYPALGIPEDPVTGSAHCNIVPYWSEKLGKTELFCKQLSARGGDLVCEFAGDRVLMSGKCVLYMRGEIEF